MPFTAKLHIQGVAGYVPCVKDGKTSLQVLMPDGTPDGMIPEEELCLHLAQVQIKMADIKGMSGNPDGYFTAYLNQELVTFETGLDSGIGPGALDLSKIPKVEDALPSPYYTNYQDLSLPLLDSSGVGSLKAKVMVEAGVVSEHEDPDLGAKWAFPGDSSPKPYSNAITVTFSTATMFTLHFYDKHGNRTRDPIAMKEQNDVEVWVKNMCDGLHYEATKDLSLEAEGTDNDFVLNYQLLKQITKPEHYRFIEHRIPCVWPLVGNVTKKCMGLQFPPQALP